MMDVWRTAGLAGLLLGTAPVTAGAPPSPAGARQISIAEFAARPTLGAPMLSPDGKRLAVRSWAKEEGNLLILDADRPDAPGRTVKLGKTDVTGITWAGNGRLLLSVRRWEVVFDLTVPVTRVLIVDLATGGVQLADPKSRGFVGGEVLHVDAEGRTALIVSQDSWDVTPGVKRVDLATGQSTVVEKPRGDVWDWFADKDGIVRAGISYDSRSWKLYYREKEGEPFRIVRGKLDKNKDANVERLTFGQAGTGTVITNEKTGRFAVYRYDFNSGAIGEPLFEHPEVDISSVWADGWTGEVSGIEYEDDRTRFHWLDPKLKALQARLDRALPDKVNEIVSRSRDNKRVLVHSRSATDPGTWFLLDEASRRMSPVLTPLDTIRPEEMAKVESLTYQARDGLRIPAYLTLPANRPAKALPLIVMPHGGPFARDSWEFDTFAQFFANRGYAVFQPQFRGSTGYGRTYVERGYGQWGRGMQDDVDDGLDHLVKAGTVDPQRVCIVGASYGGYAALWGAIRNPERYRCAASFAGVTDLDAQLKANRRQFSATRYFRDWRTKVAGEQKIDLATVSPLAQAARLNIPVLIAHGEQDQVVPVKQGKAMVAALAKGKAEVTSVFYPKSGHDLEGEGDLADYLGRLEAFLRKHNPS